MTNPRIYIYLSKDKGLILTRHGKGSLRNSQWRLHLWDLKTDEVISGQWLMGKCIDPKLSSFSPCGIYFYYHYDIYKPHIMNGYLLTKYTSVNVISKVPNFTAIAYVDGCGKWESLHFDGITGLPIINGMPFRYEDEINRLNIEYVKKSDSILPCGPSILPADIIVDELKLMRGSKLILDSTNDTFQPITPISSVLYQE